jgi:hypothetical protein
MKKYILLLILLFACSAYAQLFDPPGWVPRAGSVDNLPATDSARAAAQATHALAADSSGKVAKTFVPDSAKGAATLGGYAPSHYAGGADSSWDSSYTKKAFIDSLTKDTTKARIFQSKRALHDTTVGYLKGSSDSSHALNGLPVGFSNTSYYSNSLYKYVGPGDTEKVIYSGGYWRLYKDSLLLDSIKSGAGSAFNASANLKLTGKDTTTQIFNAAGGIFSPRDSSSVGIHDTLKTDNIVPKTAGGATNLGNVSSTNDTGNYLSKGTARFRGIYSYRFLPWNDSTSYLCGAQGDSEIFLFWKGVKIDSMGYRKATGGAAKCSSYVSVTATGTPGFIGNGASITAVRQPPRYIFFNPLGVLPTASLSFMATTDTSASAGTFDVLKNVDSTSVDTFRCPIFKVPDSLATTDSCKFTFWYRKSVALADTCHFHIYVFTDSSGSSANWTAQAVDSFNYVNASTAWTPNVATKSFTYATMGLKQGEALLVKVSVYNKNAILLKLGQIIMPQK